MTAIQPTPRETHDNMMRNYDTVKIDGKKNHVPCAMRVRKTTIDAKANTGRDLGMAKQMSGSRYDYARKPTLCGVRSHRRTASALRRLDFVSL